jgi:phospholipid transport system substrate-binding protein
MLPAVAVVAPLCAFAESGAVAVVNGFDGVLLDVLENAVSLGYQGRFDKLKPAVETAFDLDFMAEKSVGKHWASLSEADRAKWRTVFEEFMVATYAANFDHFSKQTFETLGEEAGGNDTTMVRTRVVDPATESVDLSYRLHEANGAWKIIDVYLQGTVSELAMRRSDYSSVLERQGVEALITTMKQRIADLSKGKGKQPIGTAPKS